MIPKQAIEKAIEGGWKSIHINLLTTDGGKTKRKTKADIAYEVELRGMWEVVALDPTFWQALGNALGWQGKHQPSTDLLVLKATMYSFVDAVVDGDTEKFWAELLQ